MSLPQLDPIHFSIVNFFIIFFNEVKILFFTFFYSNKYDAHFCTYLFRKLFQRPSLIYNSMLDPDVRKLVRHHLRHHSPLTHGHATATTHLS